MRYIVVIMAVCISALVLGGASMARAQAPTDSLWGKAVALWSLNDDLVPGLMKMHMQEVDKHGKIKDEDKYHEVWSALKLGEDGDVEYEMIKTIDDGEDVTEKEKAKREKDRDDEGENSRSHEMESYVPFESENQDKISVKGVGPGEVINGSRTALYEFTEPTEDDVVISGRAWLEAESGAPVKIEYTPDPLPKRVKRMVTTMEFDHIAPDSLVVSKMLVDVTGGILFIKKHFHMSMTFDAYWRLPEGYEGE
jgi:hypothetical protein